jgi:hypothetical protein
MEERSLQDAQTMPDNLPILVIMHGDQTGEGRGSNLGNTLMKKTPLIRTFALKIELIKKTAR